MKQAKIRMEKRKKIQNHQPKEDTVKTENMHS